MHFAQIDPNNIVQNVIDAADLATAEAVTTEAGWSVQPLAANAGIGWSFAGGAFAAPPPPVLTLAQAQAAKVASLRASCDAAIVGGYPSNALGAAHTYPSSPTDQSNMAASVIASLLPNLPAGWTTPFWVEDQAGNWSMQAHTAAQIQQAGSDGKAFVVAQQIKLATLTAQALAAATVAAVNAIAW